MIDIGDKVDVTISGEVIDTNSWACKVRTKHGDRWFDLKFVSDWQGEFEVGDWVVLPTDGPSPLFLVKAVESEHVVAECLGHDYRIHVDNAALAVDEFFEADYVTVDGEPRRYHVECVHSEGVVELTLDGVWAGTFPFNRVILHWGH